MENAHVYLDTSSGSEATMNEQGMLTIRAHEAEVGNRLGQVTFDAQETWILLQWLYSHTDMLRQLTHPDRDITTKLKAVDQQSKQRRALMQWMQKSKPVRTGATTSRLGPVRKKAWVSKHGYGLGFRRRSRGRSARSAS